MKQRQTKRIEQTDQVKSKKGFSSFLLVKPNNGISFPRKNVFRQLEQTNCSGTLDVRKQENSAMARGV